MADLRFSFRIPGAPIRRPWEGRWLRGIELDHAESAARQVTPPVEPEPSHREPSARLVEAWAPVADELQRAVDELTYRIWLAGVHPHALIQGTWILGCHAPSCQWIQDRFGRLVAECAGRPVEFVGCTAQISPSAAPPAADGGIPGPAPPAG